MTNPPLWVYTLAFVFISVIVITYGGQHDFGKVRFNEVDVKGSLEAKDATIDGTGVTGDALTVSGGPLILEGALGVYGNTTFRGMVNNESLAIGVGNLPAQTPFDISDAAVLQFDLLANANNSCTGTPTNSKTLNLPPATVGTVVRFTVFSNLNTSVTGEQQLTFRCNGNDAYQHLTILPISNESRIFQTSTREYFARMNLNSAVASVLVPGNNALTYNTGTSGNNYLGPGSTIDFVCSVEGLWDFEISVLIQGTGTAGNFQNSTL